MATITIKQVVDELKFHPEVTPVLGVSPGLYPALTIANDVLQNILAQSLPWKFNRAAAAPFLTVALQQDYITSITDLAWLEQGWRIDINNTSTPLPVFSNETVRDLQQTSWQSNPYQMSWIPNRLAIFGTWQANTSYPTGLGAAQTPVSPVQQFKDANGNFLYVTTNGISGGVKPLLAANSPAGTTVNDGSVVWTVADPNGIALRLAPIPATSGIVWQINPIYQKKPPIKTKLTDTIDPLPDEFGYLFRQGFLAMCLIYAGRKEGREVFAMWKDDLQTALRSADRERDDVTLFPSESLTGGTGWGYGAPIGPAWPFWISPY